MADNDRDKTDGQAESSSLSWDAASWYSTYDGYTSSDAASDTGVSDQEASDAMDAAREDSSN